MEKDGFRVKPLEFDEMVGPNGQVIIPEKIREIVGIRPKMLVHFSLDNHKIYIRPKRELSKWLGEQVKKDGKGISKVDLDNLYGDEIEEEWREIIEQSK